MQLRGLLVALAVVGCSGGDESRYRQSQSNGSGGAPDDATSPNPTGGARAVCVTGDTRSCLGPGACRGAQECRQDRTGWTPCDCGGPSSAGGATVTSGGAPASTGGRLGSDASVDSSVAGQGGTPSTGGAAGGVGGTTGGAGGAGGAAGPCGAPAIYIMLDQSASMGCEPSGSGRWNAIKQGLRAFAIDPRFANVRVGVGYFGTAASPPGSSCDPAAYRPDVEIGPLSTNAPAIITSLSTHAPFTDTPTYPALQSAISHAISWKSVHPGDAVGVVLVTDGRPNACGANDVSQVVAVADTGFDVGSIPTYVVGLMNSGSICALDPNPFQVTDLHTVAAAGGTREAVIIDTTFAGPNEFTGALSRIAGAVSSACLADAGSVNTGGAGGAGTGGRLNTGGVLATGGAPSGCGSGQKLCGGVCVPPAPSNGCGLTGCTACSGPAPAAGVLACDNTTHACSFVCLSGFTKQGSQCVSNTGAGGANGTDGGCNPATCPACNILSGPACCVSGRCGCPQLQIPGTCIAAP